jgi:hypothetical protein
MDAETKVDRQGYTAPEAGWVALQRRAREAGVRHEIERRGAESEPRAERPETGAAATARAGRGGAARDTDCEKGKACMV